MCNSKTGWKNKITSKEKLKWSEGTECRASRTTVSKIKLSKILTLDYKVILLNATSLS